MLDYPLLKELYENGFEMPSEPHGVFRTIELPGGGTDYIYYPTTQELMDGCGEHLTDVRDLQNLQRNKEHPLVIPDEKRYEAVSTNGRRLKYGHGRIVDIALVHLFLAITNPTFGL